MRQLLCSVLQTDKTQPLLISKKKRNYTVPHLRESVEKFGLKEKLVLCKKKKTNITLQINRRLGGGGNKHSANISTNASYVFSGFKEPS